ncbi:SpoIID/LytB domain-containing protein [Salibacterium salarium]|uniref:SpoIID/LytB domain-containing protein n=1 Tax=Salibacterium salarium TaxID=284579 RepID=A0A3R9PYP8_9BACI|nr:SpoIID/LytB domain-containing protein [Salibacterium salarium]RSL29940.1 SpoIID/LytB domain-containing protein [Salibacterium salarium]
MYKKITAALLSVPLLAFTASHAGAEEPQDLYDEPMTIKLVPSSNFNVTVHGSYELIDREDGETIDIDDEVKFRYGDEEVTIRIPAEEEEEYTSSEGYTLQENGVSDNNYVSITSVLRAGTSFQTTNYRGSLVIEPEEARSPDDADDAKEQDPDNEDEEETVDRLQLFNVLNMDDYLKGVVPREMSASWPIEALKAQAVAARNYAQTNMASNEFLYDTTTHQVYHGLSGEGSRSNQAVNETEGVLALHNGSPIYAYFHASSGGHTEDSENVWGNEVSYVRGVEDSYDTHSSNPNNNWTTELSREDADEAIFPDSNHELVDLEIVEKSDAGRVQEMRATGIDADTGETVEKMLPDGSSPDSIRWALGTTLKSTMFDLSSEESNGGVTVKTADGSEESYDSALGMEMRQADGSDDVVSYENLAVRMASGVEYVNSASSTFEFEGSGWGHGLGMSQWGAYNMAQQGMSYRQILKHYYTDIEIVEQ